MTNKGGAEGWLARNRATTNAAQLIIDEEAARRAKKTEFLRQQRAAKEAANPGEGKRLDELNASNDGQVMHAGRHLVGPRQA